MVEVHGMVIFMILATGLALLYWLGYRTVPKRDRYRLVRMGVVVLFAGTAMLTWHDPAPLVLPLLERLLDRPDG